MCGVTGFWARRAMTRDAALATLEKMTSAIAHRGPDDTGTWWDGDAGVWLGHRRLSILDLSPAGHQPMTSRSGRYVLSYNGEVYNFAELRKELEQKGPIAWRGHSDTEVMLEAFEQWGLVASLEKFIGMFAFALWDREERVLHLVRDRVGIKPMYYGVTPEGVCFGSELKALLPYPGFDRTLDHTALTEYLCQSCVPAPLSIYASSRKVEPGTILSIRDPSGASTERTEYWSAFAVAERGSRQPFAGSEEDAESEALRLLTDSVRLRMVSDVPVGAFLSGGIDSSLVTALMQRLSSRPVHTFSIGNTVAQFDEAPAAEAVAKHLNTNHTSLTVTAVDALAVVPQLASVYDEPFADSSQIPTLLVSRLARTSVTVALSGDGGDELFGGYNRHVWATSLQTARQIVPRRLLGLSATLIRKRSADQWDSLFSGPLARIAPSRLPGHHLHKLATALEARTGEDLYEALAKKRSNPPLLRRPTPLVRTSRHGTVSGAAALMLNDLVDYLPNDILTKVDRATMAVSLEARVPLLDHRFAAFAWSIPLSMKIRRARGKVLLRRLLARFVPPSLFERPKMGFGVPLAQWLRTDLRDWAGDLIQQVTRDNLFNSSAVTALWDAHQSARRNAEHELWDLLMFQAWRNSQTHRETL